MLVDKSFDVVTVATPDHWHARTVIDTVEAGKDVYVEGLMVHKIEEGFQIIDPVGNTKWVGIRCGFSTGITSELFRRSVGREGCADPGYDRVVHRLGEPVVRHVYL